MVAPEVASEIATDCVEVYVPPATENVGVATAVTCGVVKLSTVPAMFPTEFEPTTLK